MARRDEGGRGARSRRLALIGLAASALGVAGTPTALGAVTIDAVEFKAAAWQPGGATPSTPGVPLVQGAPATIAISITSDQGGSLKFAVRPATGPPCAAEVWTDPGPVSFVLPANVVPGRYTREASVSFPQGGEHWVCVWVSAGSSALPGYAAYAGKVNVEPLPPVTGTLTGTPEKAVMFVGGRLRHTWAGTASVPTILDFVYRRASTGPCPATRPATQNVVKAFLRPPTPGDFRVTSNIGSLRAGRYVVCGWLRNFGGSGEVLARSESTVVVLENFPTIVSVRAVGRTLHARLRVPSAGRLTVRVLPRLPLGARPVAVIRRTTTAAGPITVTYRRPDGVPPGRFLIAARFKPAGSPTSHGALRGPSVVLR